MKTKLLTGNQAIARGFYEAGGHVATSYPGSPTVEMLEDIKHTYPEIYAEFSVNEKVALEVGIGSSMTGARTLVAMKHVGVNVAADPLMTFTQTKTRGGFVLMSGDDPGMASSQNEQDNRLFAKFANMPVLDPSDSQEAKDYTRLALEVSEKYESPVMLRITSRLCHGKTQVTLGERQNLAIKGFERDTANFGMIPPNTFDKQYHMQDRVKNLQNDLESLNINTYLPFKGAKTLVITSGLVYQNLKENPGEYSIYKLGMVYPLPLDHIKAISANYDQVLVLEEMMPFIEEQLKLAGIACQGKTYFSFTGELDVLDVRQGLIKAGVVLEEIAMQDQTSSADEFMVVNPKNVMGRLPMYCAGCPHRPVFDILKKAKKTVIGDIGCYSMGILYPLEVVDSVISMGASLGMLKGMAKANKLAGIKEPLVAVIGDGTFFHSGMTGMINMLHQMDPEDNLTILVLNNGTTAMTGGQPNASSVPLDPEDMSVKIPDLLKVMGFDRVQVVDQFDYKAAKQTIDNAMKTPGLDIVITTRPCALKFKIKETPFYVDPDVCIGCRSCVKTNCPPIHMKKYEGHDKLKSFIDPTMCVGCSVCSQVCPVGAIKRLPEGGLQ